MDKSIIPQISIPLISVNTIIDTDVGVTNLIRNEYMDGSVFKREFFDKSFLDELREIYLRTNPNPLTVYANDNISIESLNNYYCEFNDRLYNKILSYSITTEMIRVIDSFVRSGEIKPVILYYRYEEKEILEDEPLLKSLPMVKFDSLVIEERLKYTQFYFKYLEEAVPFRNIKSKSTFYIADYKFNLDKNHPEFGLLNELLDKGNNLLYFNLYKSDIIYNKK